MGSCTLMLMAPFIPLEHFSINDFFNLTIILSSPIPWFLILSISATVLIFILISLFWHLQCQLGADSGKATKS